MSENYSVPYLHSVSEAPKLLPNLMPPCEQLISMIEEFIYSGLSHFLYNDLGVMHSEQYTEAEEVLLFLFEL